MALDKLFSVEEAAKKLGGISTWTVQAWFSQGRLRRTKVGRRTMVAESELERFIAESNKASGEGKGLVGQEHAVGEQTGSSSEVRQSFAELKHEWDEMLAKARKADEARAIT